MAAEDFSFYLEKVPGHFCHLGAPNYFAHFIDNEIPHHNPKFDLDERSLSIGVAIWLKIVERALNS
eukprot:TRINITY_DN2276_c0_g1_i1.p3 TRINITY_DN2276_c0_g1~~TRINITY_DN2276_c0_g1_i1.p3  ORF type:complete len:66 (+),score=11.62 TRINITY_DN2276_c0_g1_i1:748-945(+)